MRWHLLPADDTLVQQLHDTLHIDPVCCRILVQRGINTEADALQFFKPTLDRLHDPFLMQDMDLATTRLRCAIDAGERILMYGDYDVDGTTSVAMMYSFLSGYTQNLDYYLPDRDKEGYGVSLASVEYARETGAGLVIAIDCGIKAHEAIRLAKSYGIDFIVCDHHMPEGGLPDAVANLDPKRTDCAYPFKDLSGCGIAFKLAQAFVSLEHKPVESIDHLLDLVAVSTACDIVPMIGENRILTHHGLYRLNHSPRTGLWALINRINRPFPLAVSDLVFGLGPLINAAGRLGDARDAVRLMLATDRNNALDEAGSLAARNRERREVDSDMAAEARKRFLAIPDWQERKSIVLFEPTWHKGVIGIASSRMTESFHKPSVILTLSNGRAVGSARSVRGFDLYAAFQQCEDLFYSFGGHAFAAGMQMPVEHIPEFTERFEMLVRTNLKKDEETPLVEISAKISLDDITTEFWSQLKRFEPFGPNNRNPVFWASNVQDTGKSKQLDNNHVRLSLRQAGSRLAFGGIGFGLGTAFEAVKNQPFDIVFDIREEHWRGEKILSLQVKDIKPAGLFVA
jgi:single-stranded-DNA-specific exonuclease